MADRSKILDGLTWAGISEEARIARISAKLVRRLSRYTTTHTKTDVKKAVRETSPPYGRGKAITEAVEREYRRQFPIYMERTEAKEAWAEYLKHIAKRSTRLNLAYAAAFDRVPWEPSRKNPHPYGDWDQRCAWDQEERERDKGDQCIGLTHQDGHVVCLMSHEKGHSQYHIATRYKKGEIVRTYLRTDDASNLAEAAISLGGPKVKAALSIGKKVVTDWIGRRTFIHHEGQDHQGHSVEQLPWRTVSFREDKSGYYHRIVSADALLVNGEIIPDEDGDDTPAYDRWNDVD